MTIYSHSRLSTFEQCPFKFKLRYIDKIIPEIEPSIESHLGKTVHAVLEWLYLQIKESKPAPSIDDLISYYAKEWESRYKPGMVIVRNGLTAKDYFNKGVSFLLNYYQKHKPFDDNTLEVEKKIFIDLNGEGKYTIRGFIDRLSYNPKYNEYEIHDYKTANFLPTQEKMDQDRQLALYAIAIKELFGDHKKVCLTWHYLAHDVKICSRRTTAQLDQLKQETIDLIKKIEATTDFPTYVSKLCDWCEYKDMCPSWKVKNSSKDIQKKITVPYKIEDNLNEEEEKEIEREKGGELDIW
ncbi:MAG: PD-(D/E)XK nuclease family protein [archaeon]